MKLIKDHVFNDDLLNDKANIKSNHEFYLKLVDYLCPAFKELSEDDKDELRHASYNYFRALLIIDKLIDDSVNKLSLIEGLGHLEKSIKHLSYLFSYKHPFWKEFDAYKRTYFKTICEEREISSNKSELSEKDFEQLASGKSAVCYAILSAFKYLSGESTLRESLVDCLEHIHIGFQYHDDVHDFYKDLLKGQHTHAHVITLKSLDGEPNHPKEISNKFLHNYFYVSGNARKMLYKSMEHYAQAIELSLDNGLTGLSSFLKTETENCKHQIMEIELLVEKTKTKYFLKNEIITRSKELFNSNVEEAIDQGIDYLEACFDKNNMLSDFMTTAGAGRNWITSYVAFLVCGFKQTSRLKQRFQFSNFFNDSGFPSLSGGSYNSTIAQDGDSMLFFIGATQLLINKVQSHTIQDWLEFHNVNGGWSTYVDEELLRKRLSLDKSVNVSGWITPKNCVSASACHVLSFFPAMQKEFYKTVEYLLKNRKPSGEMTSYWWTSSIYATSWTILAFCHDDLLRKECSQSVDWLVKTQNGNGAWQDDHYNRESFFYTAMALNALVHFDHKKYSKSIQKGVNFILSNQVIDGSWKSERILAIPSTDVHIPSQVKKWRNSSFGVNIVVDDHRRIFTTATILNMLLNLSKATNS